jgi:hypothetical protein
MVGDRMNKLLVYLLMLLFTFHLPSSILYSYPEGWSDDILLTPETPGYRLNPDVSVDSYNNIWVVWDSNFWGSGFVYYSKRDSLGNCIIPETMLPDPMQSSGGHAKVVVDNSDNVHIQWTEPSPTGDGIGYAKLANSGSIIVDPHLAMPGYGGGESCNQHEIAIDKYKNINVVWDEQPLETNQISYTKLDSLGDTVIARIRVSPIGLYSIWPGIGTDSFANNHLGYRTDTTTVANRLTYSKLDKNGNILISNKFLGLGMYPTIINDWMQNVHMVYLNPTGPGNSIKYLKLDQEGNFLITPKTISIHENNNYPHMAMDSLQYLHVVWHLEDPMGIMYAKLDTLGDYVIAPMLVVYPPYAVWPGHPRITVDRSDRLHLAWTDQRLGSSDIYYKRGENETSIKETERLKVANLPKISVFPNPFFRETKITFSVAPLTPFETSRETEKYKFEIYDVIGRKVKEFMPDKPEGVITWQGTDDFGNYLPAGVYFLRISSATASESIPAVLLK